MGKQLSTISSKICKQNEVVTKCNKQSYIHDTVEQDKEVSMTSPYDSQNESSQEDSLQVTIRQEFKTSENANAFQVVESDRTMQVLTPLHRSQRNNKDDILVSLTDTNCASIKQSQLISQITSQLNDIDHKGSIVMNENDFRNQFNVNVKEKHEFQEAMTTRKRENSFHNLQRYYSNDEKTTDRVSKIVENIENIEKTSKDNSFVDQQNYSTTCKTVSDERTQNHSGLLSFFQNMSRNTSNDASRDKKSSMSFNQIREGKSSEKRRSKSKNRSSSKKNRNINTDDVQSSSKKFQVPKLDLLKIKNINSNIINSAEHEQEQSDKMDSRSTRKLKNMQKINDTLRDLHTTRSTKQSSNLNNSENNRSQVNEQTGKFESTNRNKSNINIPGLPGESVKCNTSTNSANVSIPLIPSRSAQNIPQIPMKSVPNIPIIPIKSIPNTPIPIPTIPNSKSTPKSTVPMIPSKSSTGIPKLPSIPGLVKLKVPNQTGLLRSPGRMSVERQGPELELPLTKKANPKSYSANKPNFNACLDYLNEMNCDVKEFICTKKDILKTNKDHIFVGCDHFDPKVELVSEFVRLFNVKSKKPVSRTDSNREVSNLRTMFGGQKAQNILITFSKLPKLQLLQEYIKEMSDKLTQENIKNLINIFRPEEMEEFNNLHALHLTDPKASWRLSEEYIIKLIAIHDIRTRLDTWLYRLSFADRLSNLQSICDCQDYTIGVVKSTSVQKQVWQVLLWSNLSNQKNKNRGNIQAFDLDCLSRVHEYRSPQDPTKGMLQFMTSQMAAEDLAQLTQVQTKTMEKTFLVDSEDTSFKMLQKEVLAFVVEFEERKKTIGEQMSSNECDRAQKTKMQDFIKKAESNVLQTNKTYESIKERIDNVIRQSGYKDSDKVFKRKDDIFRQQTEMLHGLQDQMRSIECEDENKNKRKK